MKRESLTEWYALDRPLDDVLLIILVCHCCCCWCWWWWWFSFWFFFYLSLWSYLNSHPQTTSSKLNSTELNWTSINWQKKKLFILCCVDKTWMNHISILIFVFCVYTLQPYTEPERELSAQRKLQTKFK